jgi:uncharacterized membrane protein (DUF485 family)
MNDVIAGRVGNNPHFVELITKRSRLRRTLSANMLATYFIFILLIVFAPPRLAAPLEARSASTIGFPIGLSVICTVFAVVGSYVYQANKAIFPYICPGLFSITDKSASAEAKRAAFELQFIRSQTGINAEGAVA